MEKYDFLVLGSGIAGLSAAIEASIAGKVLIISKDESKESSTEYAQGGIAAAMNDEDKVSFHFRDTLVAGDGLCNPDAVHILVGEGPQYIHRLIDWGTKFDKEKTRLVFTREAAHSHKRVLHAGGDSTGKEIVRALLAKVSSIKNITIRQFVFAIGLLNDKNGRIIGASYLDERSQKVGKVYANAVILATGGAGRVYSDTTNPELATGDGMAAAALAGAELQDMEFVQFHPTVLLAPGAPRFLLTEAIRGEGGILKNINGERFMPEYDERAELAPRDVVSRSILLELKKTNAKHVFLDLSGITSVDVRERFPQVYQNCLVYNLDLKKDLIPVTPAAHYYIGGVKADINGKTSLEGLFAAGEVSCTGVHGANRLASNSLLEGLVFGTRAGRSALDYVLAHPDVNDKSEQDYNTLTRKISPEEALKMKEEVQRLMWEKVGVLRTPDKMNRAVEYFREKYDEFVSLNGSRISTETRNIFIVGFFTAFASLQRKESRGTHYREDYSQKNEERIHSRYCLNDLF
ncbi:MAG: L-aspartate oxidase [Acidobacteria bacterium]|nr:L-aspartate oxidase [Acidobacteriota bacterium]